MRSSIWILRADTDPTRGEALARELSDRGVQATVRMQGDRTTVVVDSPPEDLSPPPDVERAAVIEIPEQFRTTRRSFLDSFATALAVGVAGAAAGSIGLFAHPPERRGDGVDELEVARLSELRKKGYQTFSFGSEPGIVVASGTKLHALSLVCTHLGCLVEWSPERRQLICPCHRASFDLGGNVLEGPPPRPLRSFEVSVQGDRVLVRRAGRVTL